MYDLTKFPEDHPIQLWGKTREVLKARVGDSWQLLYGIDFFTAGLMKPNVCMMELRFGPRVGEKNGQASISLNISTRRAKAFAEYLSKVPNAALPDPLVESKEGSLALFDSTRTYMDAKLLDIDTMEGSYALAAVAGIISPAGPELYGRLATWYNHNAEAICNFVHYAYLWNKEHGEYPLLDE